MKKEYERRTVVLDSDSERALNRIRLRDAVKKKLPSVSKVVRKSLINEAKA